ncbi:MAG: 3-deoxy-manno-octulosonate cytidylyltransferase (CMP-KDO synthetase) [Candidatus Promineifilaceae bacterium]|jgi:3-deoxy-manno-octulosonate cytidylyltransferase (CMP-KDO synthetase)
MTKPSVIGVIPARWGSTRFPGKSLAPISGRPLIAWVVERVKQAQSLSDVIVATDDQRIADVVEGLGVRAVMTRPDHPSGTDRIAEAIQGLDSDAVVNIQGDEPLISPALIDALSAALLEDTRWDMATAVAPIDREEDVTRASVVKCVWGQDGAALYFSRSPIPHVRDTESRFDACIHWRHLGIYAYRRNFLETLVQAKPCMLEEAEKLEQLRALHIGGRIRVVQTEERGIGVDTPADVPYVESLLRQECE